jgi:uncharacterized protein YkwD
MPLVLLAVVHLVAGWACTPVPALGGSNDRAAADTSYASERQQCVEITNRYRASVGAPLLAVSQELERYAAAAAAEDGRAHRAHGRFRRTNGGGVARAENLVPWWPLSEFESVMRVVAGGLEMMWAEGPRGAHRRNMEGPYTELGCGVFVNNGEVTVVQAFR